MVARVLAFRLRYRVHGSFGRNGPVRVFGVLNPRLSALQLAARRMVSGMWCPVRVISSSSWRGLLRLILKRYLPPVGTGEGLAPLRGAGSLSAVTRGCSPRSRDRPPATTLRRLRRSTLRRVAALQAAGIPGRGEPGASSLRFLDRVGPRISQFGRQRGRPRFSCIREK